MTGPGGNDLLQRRRFGEQCLIYGGRRNEKGKWSIHVEASPSISTAPTRSFSSRVYASVDDENDQVTKQGTPSLSFFNEKGRVIQRWFPAVNPSCITRIAPATQPTTRA
jgi:hypothetical protein